MLIIDRYIAKSLLSTLFFALAALCVIFLIVNLLENLDDFIDQHATFMVIATYYLYFFPEILKIMAPVGMLLATLFTIGNLSTNNEITAMKSGGMSLYRLMTPLVVLSFLISLCQLYFNGWIVPVANQRKLIIEQKYLNKSTTGATLFNIHFRDNPLRNVIMQFYDANTKIGNNISIEDFSSETQPRLIKRLEAKKIQWDSTSKSWILNDCIERKYNNNQVDARIFKSMNIDLKINHEQLKQLRRSTDEMNYDELRKYIELLKIGGKDVRQQMIEYYGDYSFPFANLVVILFGIPFAFNKRKGGIAIQIGAAMIVAFTYLIFTKVSQSIGYSANIEPIISGWMANGIFFIGAMIVLFKTKT